MKVGRHWPSTRLELQEGLLKCMQHAATCAVEMHDAWLPACEDDDSNGLGISDMATMGHWRALSPSVYSDEDVMVGLWDGQ